MKDVDTDKIIGTGLIIALLCYLVVILVVAVFKDTIMPLDVASNIITGLVGYMGRTLLDKAKKDKSPNDAPDDKKKI